MSKNDDFGFYAKCPRVVRTGFKHLSAAQKWCYVCLRDLCGEGGVCFRSVRTLSQELGLSTGMVSETIRALHDANLIHATKKKRSPESTCAVWHISVVDIWGMNGSVHPTTIKNTPQQDPQECSPTEHSRSVGEQTPQSVQQVNGECSAGERECSVGETEEESMKDNHTEEKREGKTRSATVYTQGSFLSLPPSQEEKIEMQTSAPPRERSAHTQPPKEERPAVPARPAKDAPWCPETAIQLIEFRNQKYYPPKGRETQLKFAERLFREDPTITRGAVVFAHKKLNTPWWQENKGLVHMQNLVEKDRIHTILREEMEKLEIAAKKEQQEQEEKARQSQLRGGKRPTVSGLQRLD